MCRLGSTAARLKLKGIDGGPHKRWSMWFNSTQREEPYQPLTCDSPAPETEPSVRPESTQVLHGCRQLVSWDVGLSPATSATLVSSCHQVKLGTLEKLPVTSRRKVGMTSSPHGPYGLGYTRATMAVTVGCEGATRSRSQKAVPVRIALCNSSA